ncbi:nodulin MtN21 /EamA-like transporter family protein [Euphorbia peplus]|nr:nodulin MtN21 /EamA-like transporter family protein [Euphorbia peplus]
MKMKRWRSYAAMVLIQIAYGGSNILIKIAIDNGLNQFVFVIYRHLIAMFLLAPFAFFLERKQRPPISVRLMGKIFVVASLGTTVHLNVYYAGLAYTTATVASALSNVIPSFTFFLAFLLGLEKVEMRRGRGWAKVMGTMVCIGGSMIFIFWKGGFVYKSIEDRPLVNVDYATKHGGHVNHNGNWIKGSALILVSHFAWSAWLILQGMVYEVYPARLSLTTLICFFASLQSSFLSIFFVRNPALWKLEWNIQLLCIIYCGVVISALVYYLQTWCIVKEGPVFVAMFCPLLLIIVAIFSAIAFAERLHLGSLIGAVVIILGLYGVLWGKSKDEITNTTRDQLQLQDQEKAIHVVADAK